MRFASLLIVVLVLFGVCCNSNSANRIYAKVGEKVIYESQVDQLNEQELYSTLHKLYILRKSTVEELIKEQLFDMESSNKHVSKDSFIDSAINNRLNDQEVEQYIHDQNLGTRGIPSLNNGYRLVDVRSPEGKQLVIIEYKNYLTAKLLDTLKRKYPVSIFIKPPKPPRILFDKAPFIKYRGNPNTQVTCIEISDFACENCRNNYGMYKTIFETYKDKVRFAFSNYSGAVTLSATAAFAADKQGKFWEMHDYIFEHPLISNTDTSGYIQFAKGLKLDAVRFLSDVRDIGSYKKIKENIDYIRSKNVLMTPTIIVNGRIIIESFNKAAIEDALKSEINN